MTVQQYILDQPSPLQEIMTIMRSWILDLGKHTEQKISNKVPQFYCYGPLCYFHANSDSVELCFTKGFELVDEEKVLSAEGRKHVRSITFFSVAEAEEHEDEIRRLLNEAAILNEFQFKRKKKSK
jgi:uncharacterized protein YdeI (YjbR/CyaY-like superfamily)